MGLRVLEVFYRRGSCQKLPELSKDWIDGAGYRFCSFVTRDGDAYQASYLGMQDQDSWLVIWY